MRQKLGHGQSAPRDTKKTQHFGYVIVFQRRSAVGQKYRFLPHEKIFLRANRSAYASRLLDTTSDLMARELATVFSRGDIRLRRPHMNPPAECGIQQKCSVRSASKPTFINGAAYSFNEGR